MIFGDRQLMGEEGTSGNHCFKDFSQVCVKMILTFDCQQYFKPVYCVF